MKIALLLASWAPPRFHGGIGRVCHELRRCWQDDRHDVHVFATDARAGGDPTIHPVRVPPMPMRAYAASAHLRASGALAGFDLVLPQTAAFSLFLDPTRTIPFVHTTSLVEARPRARPWRRLHPLLDGIALRRARAIVTTDPETASTIMERFRVPPGRIHRIENGVDADRFSPSPRAGDRRGFTFVTAARLIPRKRLDLLLRAIAILRRERTDVRLEIAGDGPERSRLEAVLQAEHLGDVVVFHGSVEESRLVDLYRSADAFVLPSRHEGTPMAVLEAMACALPVVIGPFASARRLVDPGRTGFVVDADDAGAWARALAGLAADRAAARRTGAAARSEVVVRFRWPETARRILDVAAGLRTGGDGA